jgi:hypothetical protein
MADILVTGQEAYFNEDVTFFKTVFLNSIGSVNSINGVIEFGNGSVNFRVPVNFYDDVNFDNARVRNLNITERLTVGVGTFVADGITGKVGIGSTIPQQLLDIAGSEKIDDFIYDSANSPGANGYYLNMDASGVRWIAATPNFTQGIYVQDSGTYIPNPGTAKSFTVLNFTHTNSYGIGTDSFTPIPNPSSPIIYNEKEVGYLGTVARHYELGTIALAVIKRAIPVDAILTVDGIPASQELIVAAE